MRAEPAVTLCSDVAYAAVSHRLELCLTHSRPSIMCVVQQLTRVGKIGLFQIYKI